MSCFVNGVELLFKHLFVVLNWAGVIRADNAMMRDITFQEYFTSSVLFFLANNAQIQKVSLLKLFWSIDLGVIEQ